MPDQEQSYSLADTAQLFFYWAVVAVPLVWGVYKTVLKLPALFH